MSLDERWSSSWCLLLRDALPLLPAEWFLVWSDAVVEEALVEERSFGSDLAPLETLGIN